MKDAFDRRVDVARIKATKRRAQVLSTISEVRHRLDPKTVVAETAGAALNRVNSLLGNATTGATSRPWLLAVGATLFGVALALRSRKGSDLPDDPDPDAII